MAFCLCVCALLTFRFLISDVFKFDPDYLENEEKYKSVVKGYTSLAYNIYCLLIIE